MQRTQQLKEGEQNLQAFAGAFGNKFAQNDKKRNTEKMRITNKNTLLSGDEQEALQNFAERNNSNTGNFLKKLYTKNDGQLE